MDDLVSAEEWDAHAEYDLGRLISRYLVWHPAPPGSRVASELEEWGQRLCAFGRSDLAALGASYLRVVPPPT